ncbi:site-specific integrase [Mycobacterium simiae]|uniref:Tyr recombinase domain-containing protein n=1 Tax=Mycobacterium simiae TaxID=1784 RepID=A0A1X0YG60_MYCSI|nr:site-specific integrase [Mycobacterium simiae]ORJ64119.1 hypothetical protein B5M45_02625 [Mycobacterium simiae]
MIILGKVRPLSRPSPRLIHRFQSLLSCSYSTPLFDISMDGVALDRLGVLARNAEAQVVSPRAASRGFGSEGAVMANTLSANQVRDVQPIGLKRRPKGATALSAHELRDLLVRLRADVYCQRNDLADPITVLIATDLRRSELLALRWTDFDETKARVAVTGKVVRIAGVGLQRIDDMKTDAGRRTIPLPDFAVTALQVRGTRLYFGESTVVFPSTARTLRDPNNRCKQWRKVRDELGVPGVTTHSFRKTVATLIDDEGLPARVGADHLGHSQVSMTQDRCMSRGRVHTEVAALLDRAIKDE